MVATRAALCVIFASTIIICSVSVDWNVCYFAVFATVIQPMEVSTAPCGLLSPLVSPCGVFMLLHTQYFSAKYSNHIYIYMSSIFYDQKIESMNGENSLLVTDQPVCSRGDHWRKL